MKTIPSSRVVEFSFAKIRICGTLRSSQNEMARQLEGRRPGKERQRNFSPEGSAQPLEKARFGQENPRKSKPFSLLGFVRAWPGFAGFG
jgi:hypothetical protein